MYPRVLLKISGEALLGQTEFGIEPAIIQRIALEIQDIVKLGVQLALVIGGGNLFRGTGLTANGIDRVSADYIGMLATVMNSLAMQDALQKINTETRVMSAIQMGLICEEYTRRKAISHLQRGRVVIFAAGTGNPFFTTDTAASLRAIEIDAKLLVKATKVDGVYDTDPLKNPTAQRLTRLTYNDIISRQLGVMDTTAVVLCRDNNMPLRVLDLNKMGTLKRAVMGEEEGTFIYHEV